LRAELLHDLVVPHPAFRRAVHAGASARRLFGDSPGKLPARRPHLAGAERCWSFTAVRRGRIAVTCKNSRVELSAGDLVILPNADHHQLSSGRSAASPFPSPSCCKAPWNSIPVIRVTGGGDQHDIV